jgi:hypothetical protein
LVLIWYNHHNDLADGVDFGYDLAADHGDDYDIDNDADLAVDTDNGDDFDHGIGNGAV